MNKIFAEKLIKGVRIAIQDGVEPIKGDYNKGEKKYCFLGAAARYGFNAERDELSRFWGNACYYQEISSHEHDKLVDMNDDKGIFALTWEQMIEVIEKEMIE